MEQETIKTNEEIKEENISVADLKVIEPQESGIDFNEFEGQKVTIEAVKVVDRNSDYTEEGDHKPGLQRPVKKIQVKTATITELDTKDGKKEIKATEEFGMKFEDGMWGYSSHEKAGIQKFMKRQKVQRPEQLIGTAVTVKATENKEGKVFLGFIKE